MKRYISSFVFLFALLAAPLAMAGGAGWETDLSVALKKAKKEGKPVLVEFTGSDWCPPCKYMHKKVFSKEAFLKAASKDFILVELDFPNGDKKLKKKNMPHLATYGVEAFPTVVLLDAKGKKYHSFVASLYPSVKGFLAHLNENKP